MTGISPLQTIHKKGLFGDHHKKNENELLKITEVINLSIIQVVLYKNSKIKSSTIKIDGLELSSDNLKVLSNNDTRILWSSPNTWLVVSKKENIIKNIKESCNKEDFAITDISHSRAVLKIEGFQAREVLKKGCPINFNDIKKNVSIGSVYHGINIVIDVIDNDIQIFHLLVLRSFGESLYHHITDASLEFGYVCV
jgi:heterotetrameric sarcosine oxidase gamma subunit|tara:strand:- start:54 stop:641 length:588 start_codon:yes stop_codon:yes gene_type:complete